MERIRSKGIEPFHYDHPNMSGELWFGEGFTNYYEELALHRSGIIDFNQFLESLTSFVNTVVASPGRLMHSAVEMSRLAPYVDAATSIDKTNRENTFISYYTYGAALGVGIDLKIRAEFPGKSLDDWMRAMWKQHPDVQKPYTLAKIGRAHV